MHLRDHATQHDKETLGPVNDPQRCQVEEQLILSSP